jgi:membrane protease YdiL (CAAX protease family)/NAD-dependent dihydropyrimidine dehydrogenase PreA subunit
MLRLDPGRCDKCMACVRACPLNAVTVGGSFVFIDWELCDGCLRCVGVCEPGAVQARGGGGVPATAGDAAGSCDVADAGGNAGAHVAVGAHVTPTSSTGPAAAAPRGAGSPAAPVPRALRRAVVDADDGRGLAASPTSAHWATWAVGALLAGVVVLYASQEFLFNSEWWRMTVPLGAKPLLRAGVLTLFYAGQLGLLAALGLATGAGFSEALGLRKTRTVQATIAVVALALGTRLFAAAYLIALGAFGLQMPDGPTTNLPQYFGRDGVGMVLTLLLVVIIGPFFEEVVFRGVLLGWLGDRMSPWPAIAISALVFAGFHINPWTFVPVAVMGAAAGWVALRYRSVWPAYALHLAYNGIAVLLTFAVAWK